MTTVKPVTEGEPDFDNFKADFATESFKDDFEVDNEKNEWYVPNDKNASAIFFIGRLDKMLQIQTKRYSFSFDALLSHKFKDIF